LIHINIKMSPKKGHIAKDNVCNIIQPANKSERMKSVNSLMAPLYVNNDLCCILEKRIRLSLEWGLRKETNFNSSIKCFPTYVRALPTGKENCECLAVDLGGTNLRCILVQLTPGQKPQLVERKSPVPDVIQKGSGEQLFKFVAEEMQAFVEDKGLSNKNLPLGFTFSFPCKQSGLASAQLDHWTKGFRCSAVEGADVGDLLNKAFKAKGLSNITVVAVLNDTTGTLMSCAYTDPSTRIGLILGTGTNACYVEKMANIGTVQGEPKGGSMVINTEWGAFGENGELKFLKTSWDEQLDAKTENPGQQVLEKMVSGMYLGELTRIILVDLKTKGLLLVDQKEIPTELGRHGSFTTQHMCNVESDPLGEFELCKRVWSKLGVNKATDEDCFILRSVCEAVSRRCCLLLAAGIAALLKKMDDKDVTVAVDGSLFRYHPHFKNKIEHRVQQLMGSGYRFRILMSEDGSGRGAAIVAAALQGAHTKGL